MVAHAIPTPASPDIHEQLWTRDLPRQHGFVPLEVEGTLPAELRGTLYRNGPGQFGQFGTRYTHPFEADGAVTAVRFEGGKALGACKLTDSAGLADERAAGRILYGLSAPWRTRVGNMMRGRQKNTANTNVLLWQGRLFALMEAAKPTELDPRDLTTLGETDLDGTIVSAFSAHPHRVAARRAAYNFGLEYGRHTRLHVYELPDTGAARHLTAIDLAGPPMLHDFIATDTHLVFFVSPVRVQIARMLLQLGSFREMFRYKPDLGTEVICVPIDNPGEPVRFTTDAFYQWHFANAFERRGQLFIDYVRYPSFDSFYAIGRGASDSLSQGRLHRATIDLAARAMRSEQLADVTCEFPTVAPGAEGAQHAHVYVAVDNPGGIARFDTATGALVRHTLPATQRATEPVVVGDHVLVLCHEADRAFVAVYDARRIADGPVARAWFDHHIPITFHGLYAAS